jgi:AhpC/TSA family
VSDAEEPPGPDAEEPPGPGAEEPPGDDDGLARLDPDRAAAERIVAPRVPWKPEPVIDTRKYQWMIGGFGFTLVVLFSIYLYAHNGITTPGVVTGKPLYKFVAPLAISNLNADANASPRCNPAKPARRGLNVCDRQPIVLAFFALRAGPCIDEINTMQTVSREYPRIQFAAIAINASKSATEHLVHSHHWTIPIAYDESGAIGEIYGVTICPMIEVAGPKGIVVQRLIGEGWESPKALAAAVARIG